MVEDPWSEYSKTNNECNIVLLTDNPVIISENHENLQNAAYRLIKIVKEHNLTTSTKQGEVMAFTEKYTLRSKINIYI
jgi:hypothetical protein